MQPPPRSPFVFGISSLPVPPKVSNDVTVLRSHVFDTQCIQPVNGYVSPREAKGCVVVKKFMQTSDVLTGLDIVHHGEENTADGVAQRNGVADAPAVNANWKLDIWFNINEVLNRVRGTVLAGFYSDFIQVAKTADHQGPGVLNEDFGVETVHDLVVKFQRLDEWCCWLIGFSIRDRPVVLQTEQ